jgi:hypothetical protein
VTIELPDHLIALERQAWAEIQAGALTVDTARAVHDGIAAYVAERQAAGDEVRRMDVELGLKTLVRYETAA